MLLDAAVTGEVTQQECQEMLSTLLEANLNPELPDHMTQQLKKMLMAHLILLLKTICITSIPEEFTKIQTEDVEIATEDIQKGKIVTRVSDTDGSIYHKNICHLLNQL